MTHKAIGDLIANLTNCSTAVELLLANKQLTEDEACRILLLAENIANSIRPVDDSSHGDGYFSK